MHVNTYPRLHLITYNNMCTIAPVHLVLLDPRHMTGQLRLSSSPSDAARLARRRYTERGGWQQRGTCQ